MVLPASLLLLALLSADRTPTTLAGFLLGSLGSLGDKLTSVMTFHIMPMAVTPEVLAGPEGTAPTLYGLLTKQNADLRHWAKFDDGQFLFMVGGASNGMP